MSAGLSVEAARFIRRAPHAAPLSHCHRLRGHRVGVSYTEGRGGSHRYALRGDMSRTFYINLCYIYVPAIDSDDTQTIESHPRPTPGGMRLQANSVATPPPATRASLLHREKGLLALARAHLAAHAARQRRSATVGSQFTLPLLPWRTIISRASHTIRTLARRSCDASQRNL
jgi:hypothetical protein